MIVDSKNIPQFIDEINIEVDQIKKELQQTIKNVEYASEYSEGVKLGDLLVGSQSTQVIAPQITMTAGPESGQFFLELPVGTESGQIVRPEVQNDANAASLVPEALLTGQTVESYLNSNLSNFYYGGIDTDTLNGNSNGTVTVPLPTGATTCLALIPIGYAVYSTWNTKMIFTTTSKTNRTINFRTDGSDAQKYVVNYIMFYK